MPVWYDIIHNMVPLILCAALVITHHVQKYTDWSWWQASRKPDLQYLSEYCSFLIPYERRHPYNRALMMIWSDLHGKEKPLSSPSWEIIDLDFGHIQILTIWEEEQGHFDPSNFVLSLLPPLLTMGGSGGICRSKKVSSLYFCIFHAELVWLTFFMPIFQNQL